MRRTARLVFSYALIIALAGTALSRDRRPVSRVSPADLKKLDAAVARRSGEVKRRILAFDKAFSAAVDRSVARDLSAARKRVEGSADFEAFKKRRVALLRRPARGTVPATYAGRVAALDRRLAQLGKLETANREIHALGRLGAPLDDRAARRAIERHLGLEGLVPRLDAESGGTVVSTGDAAPPEEPETDPVDTVLVFTPHDTGVHHRPALEYGSTYEFAEIDHGTGELNVIVESVGNDTVAWAFAGMSPNFDVPSGFSEVRITAEFDLSYRATVAGAVPPSVASAFMSVSLYDTEDIFANEIDGLAHLVGFGIGSMTESEETKGYKVVLKANLNGRSGAMRAVTSVIVKARASFWGHASARATGTMKNVKVEYLE